MNKAPAKHRRPAHVPDKHSQACVITDALRAAMKETGATPYALAADAGVSVKAVLRFLAGEQSLSLQDADRLAELLRLELVQKG